MAIYWVSTRSYVTCARNRINIWRGMKEKPIELGEHSTEDSSAFDLAYRHSLEWPGNEGEVHEGVSGTKRENPGV